MQWAPTVCQAHYWVLANATQFHPPKSPKTKMSSLLPPRQGSGGSESLANLPKASRCGGQSHNSNSVFPWLILILRWGSFQGAMLREKEDHFSQGHRRDSRGWKAHCVLHSSSADSGRLVSRVSLSRSKVREVITLWSTFIFTFWQDKEKDQVTGNITLSTMF